MWKSSTLGTSNSNDGSDVLKLFFPGHLYIDVLTNFLSLSLSLSLLAVGGKNVCRCMPVVLDDVWALRRFTNGNTSPQNPVPLTGVIPPRTTFIVSPDADTFLATYGFEPDLGIGSNGPADSNGEKREQDVSMDKQKPWITSKHDISFLLCVSVCQVMTTSSSSS